jgi:hypothetical protein
MSDDERLTPGRVSQAWNSRPVFIGAAIVIAIAVLVVAAATITALTGPKSGTHTAATAQPSETSFAQSGCSVPVGSMSTTPKMPSDLTFKAGKNGLSWPVSRRVGPTNQIDGFDSCFARSPLGAALAAQTAIYSQYDPSHTVQTALGHYIVDSPGKAKSIASGVAADDPSQLQSLGLTPAGFTIDSFTSNRAAVTLVYVLPSSATGYIGEACSMVWVDGDWKLSVLDNGSLTGGSATTPSKGDFVAWSGASS